MLNKPDSLTQLSGINAVAKINQVKAIEAIGGTLERLDARAAQFIEGHRYAGQVISKVSDTAYAVKIDSPDAQNTILRMELGSAAQIGQTLQLKYLHSSPVLTFLLGLSESNVQTSTTEISPAAALLGQYLQEAESKAAPARYEAAAVVTSSPSNAQVVAKDLKQAVNGSGLFYESHLNDLSQNSTNLAAIKAEPQNQTNAPIATLLSQQLAILENQRLSWQGQVWPGQKMDWDIYLKKVAEQPEQKSLKQQQDGENRPIFSEMTLHLPNLGSVTARLSLADGRMRIQIATEQAQTLSVLKTQRLNLAQAITKNGQQLDTLTMVRHE